jgi:hypothetical protein
MLEKSGIRLYKGAVVIQYAAMPEKSGIAAVRVLSKAVRSRP